MLHDTKTILGLIDSNEQNLFLNEVFSTTNGKLVKNNIISFDLPVLKTCPFAGDCKKFCYANKGNYRFPNVTNKYQRNYELSLSDKFNQVVTDSLKALPNAQFIRLHSSGDFYSKKYIAKWMEVIVAHPKLVFYAYTKSMKLFEGMELPSNFVMIQSEGTINDSKYLDYKKPFARIFKSREALLESVEYGNTIDASNCDINAVKGVLTGKIVGLIKH